MFRLVGDSCPQEQQQAHQPYFLVLQAVVLVQRVPSRA